VPRTRLHLDDVAQLINTLDGFAGAAMERRDGQLAWCWPKTLRLSVAADTRLALSISASLDVDGHFVLLADGLSDWDSGYAQALVLGLDDYGRSLYLDLLTCWPALYSDVKRELVMIGSIVVCLEKRGLGRMKVVEATGEQYRGRVLKRCQVTTFLFTESSRRFIYSTTPRYREFGAELVGMRLQAAGSAMSKAEDLAVLANRRIEDIRTIQARLEIAAQVLDKRLKGLSHWPGGAKQELQDLIVAADHMRSVWAMQGHNFTWIVEHVSLRANIAERASTRGMAAAVFAVATITLANAVVTSVLTINDVHWTLGRFVVIVIASVAVLVSGYGLYLMTRRGLK
jgi:hypothetical protein